VQTGQTQAGEILMSIHENEDPVYGIDTVPFLATSFAQAKKLWALQRAAVEKSSLLRACSSSSQCRGRRRGSTRRRRSTPSMT
jgi:hypothetical protein